MNVVSNKKLKIIIQLLSNIIIHITIICVYIYNFCVKRFFVSSIFFEIFAWGEVKMNHPI